LHDFSLRFLVAETVAERQTLLHPAVYNARLDVVPHQARFPPGQPQKMLDFGGNLVPK
jgi:hypothetical protein